MEFEWLWKKLHTRVLCLSKYNPIESEYHSTVSGATEDILQGGEEEGKILD